jgi:hypothetical protein
MGFIIINNLIEIKYWLKLIIILAKINSLIM